MFIVVNQGRSPAEVHALCHSRIIILRVQHNNVVCSSVLEVAALTHVSVVVRDDGVGASVEVDVESTRLVKARIWNIDKALISKLRTLNMEWSLIVSPELTQILVVIGSDEVGAQDIPQTLQSHAVATVLHGSVIVVSLAAGQRWIILPARLHTIWEDM